MTFIKVKLSNYQVHEDHIILNCTPIQYIDRIKLSNKPTINTKFIILIKDGSICSIIKTFDGQLVTINYLESGDILHIKTGELKEKHIESYPEIKLIDEINLNIKYTVDSDSSYDELLDLI